MCAEVVDGSLGAGSALGVRPLETDVQAADGDAWFPRCTPCCQRSGGEKVDAATLPSPRYLYDESVDAIGNKAALAETGELPLVEKPEVVIEDGARYTGQWRGDKCHGVGVLKKSDGSWYKGNFRDGKAHGQGTCEVANGNTYSGEWVEDKAHGFGKYTHMKGGSYEGQWVQNEKSGAGIEVGADGSKYEGQFDHGTKDGLGTYTSCTGELIYRGQFKQDCMHGWGKYHFSNGQTYEGEWENGHTHGMGTTQWPEGTKYSGTYRSGVRHGEGTFSWPDGRSFRGQWREGKREGQGVMVDIDGKEHECHFRDGVQVDPLAGGGALASPSTQACPTGVPGVQPQMPNNRPAIGGQ